MKQFNSGADLAKEMGISVDHLQSTFTKYNKGAKDKNDEFGKLFFHNLPFDVKDQFYVAIVTPVVHYCMGGVQIDTQARIVKANNNNEFIPGKQQFNQNKHIIRVIIFDDDI
jgi:succinate dehydrogenase/fumarate reductase flavoprotein subunit